MRLYYGFVTLSAGCVGMALFNGEISCLNKILLPIILFCCWGFNQIINDYLNLEEDKVNAPKRPMACGKLNIPAALCISGSAIAVILIYALWQNPAACVPIVAGVFANIYYSKTKNILLFAFSISCCAWFAYVLLGGGIISFFIGNSGLNGIVFLGLLGCNALMTFFTYFKDIVGDKLVGKQTPQVIFGNKAMRKTGLILGLFPLLLLIFSCISVGKVYSAFWVFLIGGILSTLTGILFYKPSVSKADYYYLKYNFAACCVLQSGFISLHWPFFGACLALLCVIGVLSIFSIGYANAYE